MVSILNIKGIKLNLNFDEQLSPQGRPIRLSGIAKNIKIPEKWVKENNKNILKNHWIYTFRYIGTDNFISFEFDYYGDFLNVVK